MQLAAVEAHRDRLQELERIVGAMRSLASMRLQQAERAAESARRYRDVVEGALHLALPLTEAAAPGGTDRTVRLALVVCTSEQGFVGAFNDRIIQALEGRLMAADRLLVIGTRGASLLRERGRMLHWSRPMATTPVGMPATIRELLDELYPLFAAGQANRVELLFARQRAASAPSIERRVLLPLTPLRPPSAAAGTAPLHALPIPQLLERLTAEYVYAALVEAAIESLASENSARMMTMEAARDNVARKLRDVAREAALARQEQITTELLDLVTGEQAVQERESAGS